MDVKHIHWFTTFCMFFIRKKKCLNYEVYDKWNMTFKKIEINYEKLLETWNKNSVIQTKL